MTSTRNVSASQDPPPILVSKGRRAVASMSPLLSYIVLYIPTGVALESLRPPYGARRVLLRGLFLPPPPSTTSLVNTVFQQLGIVLAIL
jgi:hypothetical protein